jgi:hypothetical protein
MMAANRRHGLRPLAALVLEGGCCRPGTCCVQLGQMPELQTCSLRGLPRWALCTAYRTPWFEKWQQEGSLGRWCKLVRTYTSVLTTIYDQAMQEGGKAGVYSRIRCMRPILLEAAEKGMLDEFLSKPKDTLAEEAACKVDARVHAPTSQPAVLHRAVIMSWTLSSSTVCLVILGTLWQASARARL